jgi:LL-diaminopimelate aminotransferase
VTVQPAQRMAALPPSFFASLTRRLRELQARGVDVIRMDMGSPDLPPPPFIVEALERSAEQPTAHGYTPFGGLPSYRAAWAEFYGRRFGVELDPDSELMGLLGSKEGIFKIHLAYVDPGDVVLIPDPGYPTYTAGASFAGAEIVRMALTAERKFLPDFAALPADALRRAKLMWLNYPNNPTGAEATLDFLAQAVALAREHGFLLAHDAPYTEIAYDGYVPPSVLQVPGAKEVAVEFHSLSKTANMAGWRVGVMAGNPEVVRTLSGLQANIDSGQFQPVLEAATAALTGDQSWMQARNAHYRERRDLVVAGVRAVGLHADTPAAAIYVWVKLPAGTDDVEYAQALLEGAQVTTTPGSIFGPSGRGYLRVSLGTATARVREAMERWQQWEKNGRQ